MNIFHKALFSSRSFKSSVGLRPLICRTIEQTARYNCWRHRKIMWPFSASSFRNSLNFLNFLNFRMQQVSLLLLSHDCSMIQTQKIPMIPDFYPSRQVSPPLQPSNRQGMHLSSFLENSTLRRVLNFFLHSRQVHL